MQFKFFHQTQKDTHSEKKRERDRHTDRQIDRAKTVLVRSFFVFNETH